VTKSGRGSIYRVLDQPIVYGIAQSLLAPGHIGMLTRKLRAVTAARDGLQPMLDIGCGPESWLSRIGYDPYGIDLTASYVARFVDSGGKGVVGNASCLPFASGTFGSVWSVGLFHHMPDDAVRACLAEALRLCTVGGRVVVLDAVMPRNALLRPLAYAIRKLDRGEFMRTESELAKLVPAGVEYTLERFTYAATGLEIAQIEFVAAGQAAASASSSAATT
jgi:hypothetical protein